MVLYSYTCHSCDCNPNIPKETVLFFGKPPNCLNISYGQMFQNNSRKHVFTSQINIKKISNNANVGSFLRDLSLSKKTCCMKFGIVTDLEVEIC